MVKDMDGYIGKHFGGRRIKPGSFLVKWDRVKDLIYVHPQSRVSISGTGGLDIFLKCSRGPQGHEKENRACIEALAHDRLEADPTGCLKRLKGGFSMVVRSQGKGTLLLAVDRLGREVLYYTAGDKYVLVSNSLTNLFPYIPGGGRPCREALDLYFALGFIPAPYTFYESVRKVPPGRVLQVGCRDRVRLLPGELEPHQVDHDTGDLSDRLEESLIAAVRRGLDFPGPHALLFSGGIDSSLVAGLLAGESKNMITTLTWAKENSDEARKTAEAAARLNLAHRPVPAIPPPWEELVNSIAGMEEPLADSMLIAMTGTMRAAPGEAACFWTGLGVDDLFGGLYEHRALCLWKQGTNREGDGTIDAQDPKSGYVLRHMLRKLYSHKDPASGWSELISRVPREDRGRLLGTGKETGLSRAGTFLHEYMESAPDFFTGAVKFAARVRLPGMTMRVVEAAGAALGVSHYSPFLDDGIAGLSEHPAILKDIETGRGKRLIGELHRRVLPGGGKPVPGGFSISLADLLSFYETEIAAFIREQRFTLLDRTVLEDWWSAFLSARGSERHQVATRVWMVLVLLLYQRN